MDMTISMLDSHYIRMPAVRTSRMLDMAQSALYAQLTQEGKRSMWYGWTKTISQVTHYMLSMDNIGQNARSVLTWNGEVVDFKQLKQKFFNVFGRRSVESQ